MTLLDREWRALSKFYKPGAWETLDAGYTEAHRAYHTWEHIADLLQKLERFRHLAARPDLVAHAIFWHDAVYRTQGPDGARRPDAVNVKESAEAFSEATLLPPAEAKAVFAMIMATADHRNPHAETEHYQGYENDMRLFLDLDLSRLGESWEEAARDTARIRHEYAFVPEKLFLETRANVLETFNDVSPLYFHPQTRALWEGQAHRNLSRSVATLRAQAKALGTEAARPEFKPAGPARPAPKA